MDEDLFGYELTSCKEKNSNSSSDSSEYSNNIIIDMKTDEKIPIGNIQHETHLIDYTNNHYINKLNDDFSKIRNNYGLFYSISNDMSDNEYQINMDFSRSNSPITIQNGGSMSGSNPGSYNGSEYDSDEYNDSDEDNNDIINNMIFLGTNPVNKKIVGNGSNIGIDVNSTNPIKNKKRPSMDSTNASRLGFPKFKKLSYQEVERTLDKYYDNEFDNKFSSEIDILTTYMKGQKNLYIQSKIINQHKLNCLMIPSIVIATLVTIIAPFIGCTEWTSGVMSGLNAIVAFFVSISNYLKLESSAELYLQMANHYDKLETSLELTNSKLFFLKNDNEKAELVLSKIKEIEKKLCEIKETNNTLIPTEIKMIFPIICSINVFAFIKKTEIYKKNLIIKFKDVKNEIRFILFKWRSTNISMYTESDFTREQNRLVYLREIKNKIKNELIEFRLAYSYMDGLFSKEIKHADYLRNSCFLWFKYYCFSSFSYKNNHNIGINVHYNPTIDKYFKFVFME
jgi:hypothetical protein